MSEHTKEPVPFWDGHKFNTCWYCEHRVDAGHNISGTPHYCGKNLSTWDGEDGKCQSYAPDEAAITWYKTKSQDAKDAKAKVVEQQRDKLLAALKDASAEFKKLPHSLGYDITHCKKYDAIIAEVEATK